MGNDLLDEAFSENLRLDDKSSLSLYELYLEHYSYYITLGMTYEEFWEYDCNLVKSYRRADKHLRDRDNHNSWLQGMYVYEAILSASPILHAFAKSGTTPLPYRGEPYALDEERLEKQEEKKAKLVAEKGLAVMKKFMRKEVKDE